MYDMPYIVSSIHRFLLVKGGASHRSTYLSVKVLTDSNWISNPSQYDGTHRFWHVLSVGGGKLPSNTIEFTFLPF